ncbi:MAG: S8 family serine peptidase [Kiritimatiellae bacterium]|nr:S8 family serine peptidase [Kiritimatiellia bacterium]MDD5523026.1 S8 family serine peptidase [Kiritimatiellia bacterium]
MIKRTTWILWAVLLICAGFFLMPRKQAMKKPAFVVRTNEIARASPVAVPPGVMRASPQQTPATSHRMAMRKEVNQGRNIGENKNLLPKQSGIDVIPGQFILSFRNEADRAAFIAAAKSHGVEIIDTMRLGYSVLVRAKQPSDLQKALSKSPVPVQNSSNYYILSPEIPQKDAIKSQGTYVAFGDQALKWLGVKTDNSSWGGGVLVAVLDNGVSYHPALREDRIARVDLVNEIISSSELPEHAGHANAVASIIAGNTRDLQGIAPSSTILSIKVMSSEGVGDSFTLAKGIVEAVDRGANVINMCLGTYGDSFVLKSAVDYALSKGVVLVAATGNEAIEGVSYPARYNGVVAVSSVDANGQHPYFANRGEEVSISAPGIGITTAWTGNDYVGFSGTSASVPFVSGAIAYLLSQNPGMTAGEAVDMLVRYADDAGAPDKDKIYGNGMLDIGRVIERDQKGIYDIAAGDIYVPLYKQNDKDMKIIVNAQNRGTETASSVEIKADVNGASWTKNFSNVAVGQTVSMETSVDLAKAKKDGVVEISYTAVISGVTDVNLANNVRRGVVFPVDANK